MVINIKQVISRRHEAGLEPYKRLESGVVLGTACGFSQRQPRPILRLGGAQE
jgi:hypothetical protein